METPLQIDFQGMAAQETLHAKIAWHVAALEKRYGRITACRVVVKDPGSITGPAGFSRSISTSLCRIERRSISAASRTPTSATPMVTRRSTTPSSMPGTFWRRTFAACKEI